MAGRLKEAKKNTRKLFQVMKPRRDRTQGEDGEVGFESYAHSSDNASRPVFSEHGQIDLNIDSPSILLTKRFEKFKDYGSHEGPRAAPEHVGKRLPTRAVGYESETAVIDKEEKRLIRVARLANRGARGSAEACQEVEEVLRGQLGEIQSEIEDLYSLLKSANATLAQLPRAMNINIKELEMTKTEFEEPGNDTEENFFKLLDFETGIWELEAMITEHCYHEAVSIVESLNNIAKDIDDDELLTRLESATEILCKELQPRGDSHGSAGYYSQLLARLNRPAEARRVLLDDFSRCLQIKLKMIPRGGGTSKFLSAVARELYAQLCDALSQYRILTDSDSNALPVFMAWFVAEIDTVYDQIVGPQIRGLKDFKPLAGAVNAVLSPGVGQDGVDVGENMSSIYTVRLTELVREDICKLMVQERKRIIDNVSYAVRHEKWELHEVPIDEIIQRGIVNVVNDQRIPLAFSCRILCKLLKEVLQTVGAFRLEGIYAELLCTTVKPLEVYSAELSKQLHNDKVVRANYLALASVFVPYAIAALEETLNYAVPELDHLRRRFLSRAGLYNDESEPQIVTRRTSDLGMNRDQSVSRWKPTRVEPYSLERDLSRKSNGDDGTPTATTQESALREMVRQKMRLERTKKTFI
mmetsp:Transcript_3481/g.10535  ORF Transcript_3481/g.10535 Transcript_3481/m.10535 type:complete len:640 (-) Transcript_3481:259-2178(-)